MNPNIELIKEKNIEAFREQLGISQEIRFFNTQKEFLDYALAFDLKEFLGLPSNCHCIFHTDHRPSAKISLYNGVYIYKCFCENCEGYKATNIIGLIKRLMNYSAGEAVHYLAELLSCAIPPDKTGLRAGVLKMIRNNLQLLSDIEAKAPTAYKILHSQLETLYCLYDIAKISGDTAPGGHVIVSASTRFINSRLKKQKKVSKELAVLAYFGLLQKIPNYLLEPQILTDLIEYNRRRENLENIRLISQIKLKRLNTKTLTYMENRAKRYREKGFKISEFTFESVAQKEDIFLANELFPQK